MWRWYIISRKNDEKILEYLNIQFYIHKQFDWCVYSLDDSKHYGIYDFCLMSGYDIFVFVFLIFVVILYKLSISKLNEIALANKKIKDDTTFCSNCGTRVEGQFCERCGKPRD